jgi:aspartate kinase
MKVIKFGGRSLANGAGLKQVLSVIEDKIERQEKFVVVLSARGNSTDQLEILLEKAQQGLDYVSEWNEFKNYQIEPFSKINFKTEFNLLENILEGVKLLQDYSPKIKDLVLAQGEILSVKLVSELLKQRGIESLAVDSREFLRTDSEFGNGHILEQRSFKNTLSFFIDLPSKVLPITTGFIASNQEGDTTTLGRNGSNYSASLLAKYLKADEVQSFTHVNGIYTANPDQVADAKIINHLSFQEANELASFGASILHAKTILPLVENNISLRILNTHNPTSKGTLINHRANKKGVKSITVQKDVCIINIEGRGLLGKKGIDARVFTALNQQNINVGVISQGSSERGLSFVISNTEVEKAITALKSEFEPEILKKDISSISALRTISVLSVIGQDLKGFAPAYQALTKNNIEVLLINNTLNGKNISLVVDNKQVNKAVNIIHSQIFGVAKNVNIAIFGKGNVGSSLIKQLLKNQKQILRKKEIKLNIFAIAGTEKILFKKNGVNNAWRQNYEKSEVKNKSIQQVIDFAKNHHLENLIAIDNTASSDFVENYTPLVEAGFDLISSNKIANTGSFDFYKKLRHSLKRNNKQYLYETNVGAGLPLIDTIKLLHTSGENITRIRGVFSGSLSYVFNHFSNQDKPFSEVLKEAIGQGLTEPDPREDLSGNDVARKLLILARELDLQNEFEDIKVKNLLPPASQKDKLETFLAHLDKLDSAYQKLKDEQKENHVLRYVGDLYGDLQQEKGLLKVDLVSVPKNSSLGQLQGSDSIFEIYTETYGDNPIIIQGAGAGAEVTARGVFGDLLRISQK